MAPAFAHDCFHSHLSFAASHVSGCSQPEAALNHPMSVWPRLWSTSLLYSTPECSRSTLNMRWSTSAAGADPREGGVGPAACALAKAVLDYSGLLPTTLEIVHHSVTLQVWEGWHMDETLAKAHTSEIADEPEGRQGFM